jgi:hypothetical protein
MHAAQTCLKMQNNWLNGKRSGPAPVRINLTMWLSPVLGLNGYEFNSLDLSGRRWQNQAPLSKQEYREDNPPR